MTWVIMIINVMVELNNDVSIQERKIFMINKEKLMRKKLIFALKKSYPVLHDDLTTFYNDSSQDTPTDAEDDLITLKTDFKLVLPFVHILHPNNVDKIDLAYQDVLNAVNSNPSLSNVNADFKNSLNNAINNVPVK